MNFMVRNPLVIMENVFAPLQFSNFVPGEKKLVPKLTLCVAFENGVVTDVALSPSTRIYLQALAATQQEDETLHTKVVLRRTDSDKSSEQ